MAKSCLSPLPGQCLHARAPGTSRPTNCLGGVQMFLGPNAWLLGVEHMPSSCIILGCLLCTGHIFFFFNFKIVSLERAKFLSLQVAHRISREALLRQLMCMSPHWAQGIWWHRWWRAGEQDQGWRDLPLTSLGTLGRSLLSALVSLAVM